MTDRFAYPLPFGATVTSHETKFRIWAPSCETLELELDGHLHAMQAEADGWFSSTQQPSPGTPYRFKLPDGMMVPDPVSRAQAGGVHDASLTVDPCSYGWQHGGWTGRPWHEAVIYELHPGAFGGFKGIQAQLPRLAQLGVTAIELMPISAFPGNHNWGYDGVMPYAPDSAYGTPDELKAMIDAAHGLGLMVFLDVVYNHFGPDGAYIHVYANKFFREDLHTPWGASIDFRRPEVRAYFEKNSLFWLMEYRFDGLRYDAVHAIGDPGFLDEMANTIRGGVEPGREVHLVLEHENNAARHLRHGPQQPGYDAQWTDDFHHAVHVLLTGETEGYYEDFHQPIQHLARVLAEGFAYQGELSPHSGRLRGEASGHLPTTDFVICLQNHDQIGNRALGERITVLADPQALRAASVLLFMTPFIPLIFMGDEFQAKTPFLFFTDHGEELAQLVRDGRKSEFKHFAAFKDPERREQIPDPNSPETFKASIPPFEGDSSFYQELLALRRQHIVPGMVGARSAGVETLGRSALIARWTLGNGRKLSIGVNLGDGKPEVLPPAGDMIAESVDGAWDSLLYGFLQERSCVAWVESAA